MTTNDIKAANSMKILILFLVALNFGHIIDFYGPSNQNPVEQDQIASPKAGSTTSLAERIRGLSVA
jgi:hypothetical protein